MAKIRYSVPLKLVPRIDNPNEDYYAPDVNEGLVYTVRHYNTVAMTCKIEVEDTETISNGTVINDTAWNDIGA